MVADCVVSTVAVSGMEQGLQRCDGCSLVSRPAHGEEEGRCPRCGARLEFRKARSIERTWAFLIAAAICYVPANLLPVLTTTGVNMFMVTLVGRKFASRRAATSSGF